MKSVYPTDAISTAIALYFYWLSKANTNGKAQRDIGYNITIKTVSRGVNEYTECRVKCLAEGS